MKRDASAAPSASFTTCVPARLDRLPWSRFHTRVVAALGITWILDGLEVTLVGSLAPALKDPATLGLSDTDIGLAGSAYLAGAVLGALLFGYLTDSHGRRRLFGVTVGVYFVGVLLSGCSWDFASFLLSRFVTGAGIGGEYGAVNSAIQELIPARRRGFAELAINGSFWVGAMLGAGLSVLVLDPTLLPTAWGWRLAFIVGGLLALVVMWVRRFIPESPRWLLTHGRPEQAEAIVDEVEAEIARRHGPLPPAPLIEHRFQRDYRPRLGDTLAMLVKVYPQRTVLGLTLMATQAFCYNAIFFTYALVLSRFYHVAAADIGWYILPFALGNFLGPLLLGPLFDSWGRRPMISLTYGLAGVLMIMIGYAFAAGLLSARMLTAAWSVLFFFASAGASAAYLTIGEVFPLESRAITISLFYAFGTLLGGVAGPALFGALTGSGERGQILLGYALGGALMLLAAWVELVLGIGAERRGLESVAPPLSRLP